ncbi:MAG: hypothetical protein R3F14_31145 [Polyangiaceae bacterium]
MRERLAGPGPEGSIDAALEGALATPFVPLIEAFRADLGLPDEGIVDAVGDATFALYLHLRVQDDLIDEPHAFDPSFAYAAEVLSCASVEAFARAVGGSPAFWSYRTRALGEMASTSAWEIDTYRAMDLREAAALVEAHAARLGRQARGAGHPAVRAAVSAQTRLR